MTWSGDDFGPEIGEVVWRRVKITGEYKEGSGLYHVDPANGAASLDELRPVDEPSVVHDAYRAAIQTLAELAGQLPPDELEDFGKYQAALFIKDAEAHVERYNADPAARPSVDEMVEALAWCWERIEPCESRSRPWARWCVVTQRSEKEHHVYHYGPTPTAAIRAAFEAVTKGG